MKPLSLLIIPFLLFQFTPANKKIEKTFYYFCDSHSMYSQTVNGKQVILYTNVYEITCEPEKIPARSAQWAMLVNKNCENEKGCTSDFNYYYTREDAQKNFEVTRRMYSDTSKYIAKMIDFK